MDVLLVLPIILIFPTAAYNLDLSNQTERKTVLVDIGRR